MKHLLLLAFFIAAAAEARFEGRFQAHFSPVEKLDLVVEKEIAKAKDSIDIAIDGFGSRGIRSALLKALDKGVELIWDEPAQPIRFDGMEARLAQVFVNLISNAIKYTDAGAEGHGFFRYPIEAVKDMR